MAAGLQVWDANGNPRVELSDRFFNVLGTHVIPLNPSNGHPYNGSLYLGAIPTGNFFVHFMAIDEVNNTGFNFYYSLPTERGPLFTLSGQTLLWEWQDIPSYSVNGGSYQYPQLSGIFLWGVC